MKNLSDVETFSVTGGAGPLSPLVASCLWGAATAYAGTVAQRNDTQQTLVTVALGCLSGAHATLASIAKGATKLVHATNSVGAAFAAGVAGTNEAFSPAKTTERKFLRSEG